ncbi:MAG: succinylglutamate desuccinylase/aspartoacylase family protein [bacterium]
MIFKVGNLAVKPGTREFGHLQVAQRPASDLNLPLTVVHGAEPGPVLGITAGIHACEYAGVVTCMRLGQELDPKRLRGTVIMVPVVNVPSFENRTPFVNPIDGLNVNRVFPGDPWGSTSYQMAHTVYQEVTLRSDAYIDLHSGDLYEAIPLHTCCQRVGDTVLDAKAEKLASLFNCDLLCIMGKGIDDLTATEDEQGTMFAGLRTGLTSLGNASLAGKPAVLIEAGGAGTLDSTVVKMEIDGIHNVMRHLGMLDGKPVEDIPHTTCYGMYIMKSKFGGMYLPDVQPGDLVKKGDRLGEMRDIRGNIRAEFTAPMNGVILMMYTTPVRTSGETIVIMGRMEA